MLDPAADDRRIVYRNLGAVTAVLDSFKAQHVSISLVMHEQGDKQNDRQRDADQPEQRAFSERHDSLR